jgi:hypothetical protein
MEKGDPERLISWVRTEELFQSGEIQVPGYQVLTPKGAREAQTRERKVQALMRLTDLKINMLPAPVERQPYMGPRLVGKVVPQLRCRLYRERFLKVWTAEYRRNLERVQEDGTGLGRAEQPSRSRTAEKETPLLIARNQDSDAI